MTFSILSKTTKKSTTCNKCIYNFSIADKKKEEIIEN